MKKKYYAPGNKKPQKNKNQNLKISIDDVPDFYFSSENYPKVGQPPQIPYLFNKRISLIRAFFIKLLKNLMKDTSLSRTSQMTLFQSEGNYDTTIVATSGAVKYDFYKR